MLVQIILQDDGRRGRVELLLSTPPVAFSKRQAGFRFAARQALVAADDTSATIRLDDPVQTERVVPYDKIDRAKTVFVWGPAPKPGKAPKEKKTLMKEQEGS